MRAIAAGNPRADGAVPGRRWFAGFLAAAAAGALLVGCNGVRNEKGPPPPVAPVPAVPAEFVIADNANDTWNTVGQILVRLPGVEYESRAQMMGLYSLRYLGEPLLIRTQALAMESPGDGVRTRVIALQSDGKPNASPGATELLKLLQQRVPLEIDKYRTPVKLNTAKKAKTKAKPKAKPKKR